MMKKMMVFAAMAATFSMMAAELAVSPLSVNAFKESVTAENTVTGLSEPGCSIDFPHRGAVNGKGVTAAKLVFENLPGGAEQFASDFQLNLRKDNKVQTEAYGVPGGNPNEVWFYLKEVPEEINLIRLYVDKRRRVLGKEVKIVIKSLSLEQPGNVPLFIEIVGSRIGNCDTTGKFPTFTAKPQNSGSSVIISVPDCQRNVKFTKAELGLTMLKGELDPAAMEANPRDPKLQASAYKPTVCGNKYTFTFSEPFADPAIFFFYFNRNDKLTGQEISFRIDYLRLIP